MGSSLEPAGAPEEQRAQQTDGNQPGDPPSDDVAKNRAANQAAFNKELSAIDRHTIWSARATMASACVAALLLAITWKQASIAERQNMLTEKIERPWVAAGFGPFSTRSVGAITDSSGALLMPAGVNFGASAIMRNTGHTIATKLRPSFAMFLTAFMVDGHIFNDETENIAKYRREMDCDGDTGDGFTESRISILFPGDSTDTGTWYHLIADKQFSEAESKYGNIPYKDGKTIPYRVDAILCVKYFSVLDGRTHRTGSVYWLARKDGGPIRLNTTEAKPGDIDIYHVASWAD